MNSNKLTKEMLLDIWKSKNYFYEAPKESKIFTLSFNSNGSIGSLWYVDTSTDKTYPIAEGAIEFINNNDDTYVLTINSNAPTGIISTIIKIRLYMPSENKPSFKAEIPDFGEITFVRLRPEKK